MESGLIQHDELCLSMPTTMYVGAPIVLQPCEDATKWNYAKSSGLIESREKVNFCVSATPESPDLISTICDPEDYLQKFVLN